MSRLADETTRAAVPEKPALEGLEAKWDADWEASGIYRFDETRPRAEVFSIDTPPPTVSGSLHVGHVFSYTHTDIIARYRRMSGQAVFYPMGWDDNGLPTERRVQNYYGVRCDPSLPYDPDLAAPPDAGRPSAVAKRRTIAVSRPNFIELCEELTASDERAFEDLFRRIGLSVDWTRTYATIDAHCRRVSQLAFLENLERGEAYQIEAPSLWDTTFQTAVAQAELDDREVPGAYHKLRFAGTGGADDIWIDTTRPELVPSCVALVAHPDDGRYRPRFGSTVRTPVFDVEVPVLAHALADPDKGTGIAMICTFGDTADVTWWRELNLPVRTVIGRDGRLAAEPPAAVESAAGRAAYARLAGKTAAQARAEIAAVFAESGDIDGEPRPITHPVKFFEKGDKPLEIVSSRQWYIRNGGRDDDLRQALIDRGVQMNWVPAYMRARYESWIAGLNGDWLISRQRFFGVPIPLWYRLDADGSPLWDAPIRPDPGTLPVDPSADCPPGYDESQRGRPGGFAGDPDVMDTWATSSLTPQIATGWRTDEALYASTFPMDMRPQAHDIIRTWLFSTVVRAHFDAGAVPWHNCALSGWILDPDRKKMSKSRGNVQVPTDLLERYGADAVRYWAACGRPGTDTAFDEQQFRIGRRLAVKLLNASKFVLRFAELDDVASVEVERREQALGADLDAGAVPAGVTGPLDRSMLHRLAGLVDDASQALDAFDYARALERTESFFWAFTDDHIELVKARAYGEHGTAAAVSARLSLRAASRVLQQLFAPFMPFVAEEVWRWWHPASVHASAWPQSGPLRAAAGGAGALPGVVAAAVLGEVRRAKSEAKRPLRTEVLRATVADTAERIAMLATVVDDVRAAGRISELVTSEGPELSVACDLAPEAAA
ncbi:MAG: valine--tRNA ligase [Acidimicrobiaceae bacterium]|nr:valine--tRNA ligase [Acidimicrobiaceae bacterium]